MRIWTSWPLALAIGLVANASTTAELRPETRSAWRAYVAATEDRRARELGSGAGFLALDFQRERDEDRRRLASGAIIVHEMSGVDGAGRDVDVPSALVHHWRGAVMIRGLTAPDLLSRMQFADPPAIQDDVLASSVLARGPHTERVYLRLQRTKIVTVVYNTEHEVVFQRYSDTRAASSSIATRIAEVRNAGSHDEYELPPGEDRGFLWALNAYWRYETVPGGVIAECESVTLSRSVPALVRYIASPLISGAASESMERTLQGLRRRYEKP